MESMLRERADPGLCSYDCLAALLQLLLIGLLREEASGKKSAPAPLPATQRAEHRIVEQALRLLADRAGRKLSLRELAAALNVSVPYLCRLFDEHLGMPPGRYISKIRLEECKALLREGELSMGKGVRVTFHEDNSLSIDLHIVIDKGVNIRAICSSIISEVRYFVTKSTGTEVRAVNVFVDSITMLFFKIEHTISASSAPSAKEMTAPSTAVFPSEPASSGLPAFAVSSIPALLVR